MKTIPLLLCLAALFCLVSCSKSGHSSTSLIPATAAEVMASPEYKLEQTTTSGLKLYTKPLASEVAQSIPIDNPDADHVEGDAKHSYYFLVVIRDGKIVGKKNELTMEQAGEVTGFVMQKAIAADPEMQKMLKDASGKK